MGELIRKNFEPGKWLLVSGVLLSVTLMLQLYAINETVDISSLDTLLGKNFIGLLLIVSYLLTTVVMLIVVIEYYGVRKKVEGLIALTDLLDHIEELKHRETGEVDAEAVAIAAQLRSDRFGAEDVDIADAFDDEAELSNPMVGALLTMDEDMETPKPRQTTAKKDAVSYKTIEVKIGDEEDEAQVEELELNKPLELEEVEDRSVRPLQESEVISTLSELERVVEELKTKKPPIPRQT